VGEQHRQAEQEERDGGDGVEEVHRGGPSYSITTGLV
jgi:hypothetical protein